MKPFEYEAYDTALAISMQSKGGLARAASMTPQERSECASKAAKARWAGTTTKKKKGRRLAPRRYRDLPGYLAPKLVDDQWLAPSPILRDHTIKVVTEIIAKALEKREDGN